MPVNSSVKFCANPFYNWVDFVGYEDRDAEKLKIFKKVTRVNKSNCQERAERI